MAEEMRPTLPQNFIPFFSPSYRKKMKKPVLDGREIILRQATPDFKISRPQFPAIVQELKDARCASSVGTIKFTLSLYSLTWRFLRGDEDARERMQHFRDIGKSWYTTPIECLIADGVTWEMIQDEISRQKIEQALADSFSKKRTPALERSSIELPDNFQQAEQAIIAQIHASFVDFAGQIDRLQTQRCDNCPKAVKLGECFDNLAFCQNELSSRDNRIKDLEKRLAEKDAELQNIKNKMRLLAE